MVFMNGSAGVGPGRDEHHVIRRTPKIEAMWINPECQDHLLVAVWGIAAEFARGIGWRDEASCTMHGGRVALC